MKIYTKTGDSGDTSLFGGQRVHKDNPRLNAYGTVDELNAVLGLAASKTESADIKSIITQLQNQLFSVGSDLATPIENSKVQIERISETEINSLEKLIDDLDVKLPEIRYFILPGGTEAASVLHIARTVCRRAEREIVSLSKNIDIGSPILIYLNRLSDLLFVLARYENYVNNIPDIKWEK